MIILCLDTCVNLLLNKKLIYFNESLKYHIISDTILISEKGKFFDDQLSIA
jgi:hypothetical protein